MIMTYEQAKRYNPSENWAAAEWWGERFPHSKQSAFTNRDLVMQARSAWYITRAKKNPCR